MKFFSKLLLALGILLIFLSLALAVTSKSYMNTYFEFKDEILMNDFYDGITDEEIEARYEAHLVNEPKSDTSTVIAILLSGIGFIAAAFGILYLDRAFKRNEKGEYAEETH
ncbi:MAG: hypothetical protein JXN65_03075 [Clostridia bacterium]|nr:hypothetical protein [Clostridia bacterium]